MAKNVRFANNVMRKFSILIAEKLEASEENVNSVEYKAFKRPPLKEEEQQ